MVIVCGASLLIAGCGSPAAGGPDAGLGGPDAGSAGSTSVGAGGIGASAAGGQGPGNGGASGTGAVGAGGTAGGGGAPACPSESACSPGAVQCDETGVPRTCVMGANGCPSWRASEPCSGHQACHAGTCACADDPRCAGGAGEGDFCPTAGGSSFGHCAADGNGCLFVSAVANACADGQRCEAAGVVATGAACGCPADGATLGTGCAASSLDEIAADTVNGAVVRCQMAGACPLWKLMVDCAGQSLTAGTVGGQSACVCKPADATAVYVDPAPGAAPSLMQGAPTGGQYPAACRFPSVRAALDHVATHASVNRIVISHQSAPATSVHLGAATGESFPVILPPGVTLSSSDGPTADPALVVLDVGGIASVGPALVLGADTSVVGLTIDAAGAAGTPNAATNVTSVVTCISDTASTPVAALDHVVIRAKAGQTGIVASGPCALAATGGAIQGAAVGVDVARSVAGAHDVAAFSAVDMSVTSTSPGSIGFRVGAGLDGGSRSSLILSRPVVEVAGSAVVVAGGTATLSEGALRFTVVNAAPQNRGLVVSGGSATLDRTVVTMIEPATGANVVGAAISGGEAVLSGVTIVGAGRFTGVEISGTADVSLTGKADARARVATTLAASSADASSGLVLVAGATAAKLTLAGAVEVSGFRAGVVVNDGNFEATGADLAIAGNRGDGVRLLGATAGPSASLDGIGIHDNGGTGLVVRTIVPVAVSACAIESNGADGIDVQRSQPATLSGVAQLTVDGCRVAANGGRGIALSGLGAGPGALAGGKVAVHLTKNTIKGNANVGVFVSEATDAIDGEDVTELWAEDNDVAGNLTTSVPSTVMAGGFFFASSDTTTRVMLRSFLGNQIHGNGRAEIGFALVQDDAQPWNLSARAADPSALCSDSADSNAVYCYDTYPGDYAIAVSSTSVHLEVKGMHFQDTPALGGRDFTAGIPSSEITAFCPPRSCP